MKNSYFGAKMLAYIQIQFVSQKSYFQPKSAEKTPILSAKVLYSAENVLKSTQFLKILLISIPKKFVFAATLKAYTLV